MRDLLNEAINQPSGKLAQILLRRVEKTQPNEEMSQDVSTRLDRIVSAPGHFGLLARVRLAADVAYLFERAPNWTTRNIVPLFDWASPEAPDAWEARKYANNIGSPQLFALTKLGFLGLFGNKEVGSDEIRTFADWLTLIALTNQARHERFYPLSSEEARAALRRAGDDALSSVGHRLAITLQSASSDEKIECWRTMVGPVFQAIWPLDVELQNHKSTFKLVQILTSSGAAFPEAADVIIPFVRPDDPRSHTALFSISQAPAELFALAPEKMLDLVAAVVGDAAAHFDLAAVLTKLREQSSGIVEKKKYQRLSSLARPT